MTYRQANTTALGVEVGSGRRILDAAWSAAVVPYADERMARVIVHEAEAAQADARVRAKYGWDGDD